MDLKTIKIGDEYSFEKVTSKSDVLKFAELTGDYNKLHIDEEFGKKSIFKKNIAHGMLVASYFSTLVGMYCPGENGLYLQQTINFRSPIFYNDHLLVKGTVLEKNESIKIITIKMEIFRESSLLVDGIAKVKLLV